jgi:hypothetical protein
MAYATFEPSLKNIPPSEVVPSLEKYWDLRKSLPCQQRLFYTLPIDFAIHHS